MLSETSEAISRLRLAWSRSSRLIILQAVGALILLWCLVFFLMYRLREDLIDSRQAVMAQTVAVVQEQTSQIFTLLKVSLQLADQWIARHPDSHPSQDPEFIELVDMLRKSSGGRVDIRMVTRANRLDYVPYRADAAATDVSDREYVTAQNDPATRGLYIASPVLSRITKKWGIPVSLPTTSSQSPIAIVFGAIELDDLFKTAQSDMPEAVGQTVALVRADGVVLGRRPFDTEIIGKSISQFPEWRERMGKEKSGVLVMRHSLIDEKPRIVAYSRLDDYPAIATLSVPIADVLQALKHQVAILLFFACAVTAVVLGTTFRLIRAVQVGEASSAQLEQANQTLKILSITDKLTQVFNRVKLDDVLRYEMQRAARYGTPLSVILLDLDLFKDVNDRHGHNVGDEVLVRTAQTLMDNIRTADTVGRWGGEEFLIILPQTRTDQAVAVAEKIRLAIEADRVADVGPRTASLGVGGFHTADTEVMLLARADRALYEAKAQGRNRVVLDVA